MKDLGTRLKSVTPPDEIDAERRAWAVVHAAYEEADVRVPRRWPSRPLLGLAVVAALAAAALTPPGRAVTGWVRETIGIERVDGREDAQPALVSLPAEGRLLVLADGGAWVVRANGSKRRLGRYDDAAWSPQGLHVALARGARLVAATPDGAVRWTVTKRRRILAPAWSPSGFRVVYGVGDALRVVHGDGEPDRPVARRAVPRTWSWRPVTGRNVVAYAAAPRRLVVADVDEQRVLWRVETDARIEQTAWTADGRAVLARTPRGVEVFGVNGADRGIVTAREVRPAGLSPAPAGSRFAVVGRADGRSRVLLADARRPARASARLFSGAGRFGTPAWAPDGSWLLVPWPSADQWVFLRMPGLERIRAVSDIAREFNPGGTAAGRAPRLSGWCCPPEPGSS